MSSVGATGFVLETLAQRILALQASFQAIFGPNINLDPNSVDGQTLGIFAESAANLDLLAQAIYDSFDPEQATGAALSRLVQLNGISRMIGSYSLVALVCTGTPGVVIPAGSLITSQDGTSQWATLDAATIGSGGSVTVVAASSAVGPIVAAANVLTVMTTPIYGWLSVTNPNAIPGGVNTVGTLSETDEALRARRDQSTATPSQGITDGIYGAILNIQGVTAAVLYENPGQTTDSNGLPPHSMNLVVSGGSAADIGEALWLRRSVGSTQVGAQSVIVDDSYGNPHTMKFDIPTAVPIYVIVNGAALPGYPSTGAADIQAAIVAWAQANLGIGDEVVQSALYTPVNTEPGVSITSIYIGTSPAPASTANIPITFNQIASFSTGNITVNIS